VGGREGGNKGWGKEEGRESFLGSHTFANLHLHKTENEMMEGVNSTMMYCKNFCKCHSVPPVQQFFKKPENEYSLNVCP
jgi:hypothetical protein